MKRGYVYILSNTSMPGLLKIGRSTGGGEHRAKGLYVTGVPERFHLEFELLADDANELETLVHERLQDHRVNDDREFFKCSVDEAIHALLDVFASERDLRVCYVDEYSAVEAAAHLAFKINTHPFRMCNAFHFMTDEEAKELENRNEAWLKQRAAHGKGT